jgi:hypothetical protein
MLDKKESIIKDAWNYIYGSKSHMNFAGKILLGIPVFPFVFIFVFTFALCDFLFSKE